MTTTTPSAEAHRFGWILDQPYLLLSLTSLFWAGNIVLGRAVAGIDQVGVGINQAWRDQGALQVVLGLNRHILRPLTFFSDPEAKRLLNRACTKCHGLDRIESSRNAEERWRVIAVDMRERGALLADEELEQLVEWLGRVWGTNQDK